MTENWNLWEIINERMYIVRELLNTLYLKNETKLICELEILSIFYYNKEIKKRIMKRFSEEYAKFADAVEFSLKWHEEKTE